MFTFRFKLIISLLFIVLFSGCATTAHEHHFYPGDLKNLSEVGIIKDSNNEIERENKTEPYLMFVTASKYGDDGKTKNTQLLYPVGFAASSYYVELLPGKYSMKLFCSTRRSGTATFFRDVDVIAGKTMNLSCEPVPENNLKVYIKLNSVVDTDINFKRILLKK